MTMLDRALVTILVALGSESLTHDELAERSRITPPARFAEALEIAIDRGYVEREGLRFYAAPRRPNQATSDKATQRTPPACAARSAARTARRSNGGAR